MERAEIMSQILAILEDVAEIAPEDVNENSVLMDDLDLSSMEILTIVADLEETFGLRIPEKELRNFVTIGDLIFAAPLLLCLYYTLCIAKLQLAM